MENKKYFFPVFLLCIGLVFLIFLLGEGGFLGFLTDSVQSVFFPLGALVRNESLAVSQKPTQIETLQQENTLLRERLVQLQQIKSDNAALQDQFQTSNPSPKNLLPVQVVGMPHAIPNVTFPNEFVINAGRENGIQRGLAVVVRNELIGMITSVSNHFATVTLLTSPQTRFAVLTSSTRAVGIATGQGNGQLIMGNILLTEEIKNGDTVVTSGGQNESGIGFPPGFIVGKIISIEKNPSSLFQSAVVAPLVAFDRLQHVFVVMH